MHGKRATQLRFLALLCLACLTLSSCAPKLFGYPSNADVLLFSADVWGGTHFSESLKKQVFKDALSAKGVKRLEQYVPFESVGGADVQWFLAYYEVDATQFPPALESGFELVVIPNGEPKELFITNKRTGVSWLVKLGFTNG